MSEIVRKSQIIAAQQEVKNNELEHNLTTTLQVEEKRRETEKLTSSEIIYTDEDIDRIKHQAYLLGQKSIEEQLPNIKKLSYELGIKEGVILGENKASKNNQKELFELQASLESDYITSVDKINDLFELFQHQVTEKTKLLEPIAIEVIFQTFLKLLGESNHTKELIETTFKQVFKKVSKQTIQTIYVSVADFKSIEKRSLSYDTQVMLKDLVCVPDSSILPGGCKVETSMGDLDARLDVHLNTFKQYLIDSYKEKM